MVRVLSTVQRERSSIPGRVILKTQKMLLYAALLYSQYYKVQINCRCRNSGKKLAPSLIL